MDLWKFVCEAPNYGILHWISMYDFPQNPTEHWSNTWLIETGLKVFVVLFSTMSNGRGSFKTLLLSTLIKELISSLSLYLSPVLFGDHDFNHFSLCTIISHSKHHFREALLHYLQCLSTSFAAIFIFFQTTFHFPFWFVFPCFFCNYVLIRMCLWRGTYLWF